MQLILTPELLMEAYRQGLFPMAYNSGSPYIHWICPEMRGQLSITDIHIPRRLLETVKKAPFEIRINADFEAVLRGCAEPTPKRPETWINASIFKVFCDLHERGHAHSVECWEDDKLVGGIYGLAIGGAFFGESMFSRMRDASKIALLHMVARLWKGGFTLLDTQFVNEHLKQFGAYELPHDEYKKYLEDAVKAEGDFLLSGLSQEKIMDNYLAMRESN
ncbi:MAG TPA: leucyl/phenylalanyl-tRNA--protein transferase [Alphaproteobacteria bacterium]|jgi:leucyl/phenylalanyl-tRNA---protein transferase|nr:leucyl/phenylalanyl-tRNA--protein transferase [Micavibrio sp.]MBK9562198.1 leucyl/phenylalanyl-tRNA--protein transferase [Micavibrio sp.]HQX27260.1 leucyl/phenylalanyl-tRNA--protein transferase [Alphaproteobacteria bacterium]